MEQKKADLKKEKQKLLPNVFEVLKSNNKRKRADICDDPEYLVLMNSLNKKSKLTSEMEGNKDTRKTYTEEEKRLTISLSKRFPKSEVAEETKISVNNIKKWKNAEEDLGSGKRGKRVMFPQLEERIKAWFKSEREKKNLVSIRRLIAFGRKEAEIQKIEKLKFSWGWVSKFIKRNGYWLQSPKAKVGKEVSLLQKNVLEFKEKIKNLLQTGNYDLNFVLNIDETGIATETTKSKTIVIPEESEEQNTDIKEATVRSCNKEREITTVLVGGTWSGQKLPVFVILKGKGVKKVKTVLPKNIRVEYREKGSYMDRPMMRIWVKSVFKNYASKLPENKRGILLIDGFKGHLSDDIEKDIKALRFDILKFPAECTKFLQPMDLSVNRSLKNFYSHKWESYISSLSQKNLTKSGYFQAPTREDRVAWISWAWENVTETIVSNGFNVYKKHILPSDPASESPEESKEESKSEDETLDIQMFKDNQEPEEIENLHTRIEIDNLRKEDSENEDEVQGFDIESQNGSEMSDSEEDQLEVPKVMNFDILNYILVLKDE